MLGNIEAVVYNRGFAVLIGIDGYDVGKPYATPRRDSQNKVITYGNLKGCVNDAFAVEDYLIKKADIPETNIKKLLAPNPDRGENDIGLPAGPQIAPTYKNWKSSESIRLSPAWLVRAPCPVSRCGLAVWSFTHKRI
ncbi:hypothetical protein F5882DRAFT_386078 [Hyaloscypha sp. PMI_1271]|nr:hypothetical protein F5882DRAFT_386078 [Hyaloscypha sp. PMI_1271]